MPTQLRRVTNALVSVSDKTGVVDFVRALVDRGVSIVSTGGTRRVLSDAGLPVTDVADITGFPEMMDGRVKTLHPKIHGGLLAIRENPEHEAAMYAHNIGPIDLLVVSLYPFEATVASGADDAACIENIDIGGPALIRGGAKNHADVTVVVDRADFTHVLDELDAHSGATSLELRRRLAQKAYARTALYDAEISNWFAQRVGELSPPYRTVGGTLAEVLRYGENPHQAAAFYRTGEGRSGVATAHQVQGKQLSFNNINDTDAAFECLAEFDAARTAAVVIVKHANPCGVAEADTLAEAYAKALRCDPVSAFGGIVAVNRPMDAAAAREIAKVFTEVIIAPAADAAAMTVLAARKNLRLLLTGGMPDPRAPGLVVRSVAGGLLTQTRDNASVEDFDLKVVTRRAPTPGELDDLRFAFRVAKHVKSNAIVYAKDLATVGIGAGQMSRVDAARMAAWKAADAGKAAGLAQSPAHGAVVASDAFFPFADGLVTAADAGVTAVIQPGGSVRDAEVVAAADARDLAMVFTGHRHFRH